MKKKEKENMRKWELLALIWGYNESAKMVETLGEKVFLRMARDYAEEEYKKIGGQLNKESNGEVILTLGERFPFIEFTAKDIDLMRKTVQKYDNETLTTCEERFNK